MNKLFIVSGHSGGGKTTIMRKLMDNELISFTTRAKRAGEVDGKDYIFITKDEFDDMFENGRLAEWTEYSGNYYGLTKHEIESKLDIGNAFCIVDAHGFKQMKEMYPDAVSIFIYTDKESAVKQMVSRGDEPINIEIRLKTFEREMRNKNLYDYVIKNNHGRFDNTVEIVKNIILSETSL